MGHQVFMEVPVVFKTLIKLLAPRLLALDRLFRMTLDINSPEFVAEIRPWKHSVVDLFYYAFEPLWMDENACPQQSVLLIPD